MKKLLIVMLSLLSVFILSTAIVFAARHHNNAQITTVAEVKANGWDDQRVLIDGKFTEHIYKDIYTFTDIEGNSITVDVDDDLWYQLSMDTPVRIYAEVDKDWHGEIELEVKHIEKR